MLWAFPWLCRCALLCLAVGKKNRWPGLAAVLEDRVAAKDNVTGIML